jgi:hypothetical protein
MPLDLMVSADRQNFNAAVQEWLHYDVTPSFQSIFEILRLVFLLGTGFLIHIHDVTGPKQDVGLLVYDSVTNLFSNCLIKTGYVVVPFVVPRILRSTITRDDQTKCFCSTIETEPQQEGYPDDRACAMTSCPLFVNPRREKNSNRYKRGTHQFAYSGYWEARQHYDLTVFLSLVCPEHRFWAKFANGNT